MRNRNREQNLLSSIIACINPPCRFNMIQIATVKRGISQRLRQQFHQASQPSRCICRTGVTCRPSSLFVYLRLFKPSFLTPSFQPADLLCSERSHNGGGKGMVISHEKKNVLVTALVLPRSTDDIRVLQMAGIGEINKKKKNQKVDEYRSK